MLADKLSVLPLQIGALEVREGAFGVAFTVTVTEPADELHPLSVAIT